MSQPVQDTWEQIQTSISQTQHATVPSLFVYLALGGLLAMYIRFLYSRTSAPTSYDSIARVFPLLTLVTIAVISVVKSSLTLSLGLVGALSIVRFRAAIKDPEELVYLFLCIGVGLALGAEQWMISITLVIVASLFVLVFDRLRPSAGSGEAYLTIAGSASRYFSDQENSALTATRRVFPKFTVQRCDIDGEEGQLRVQLHRVTIDAAPQLVAELRKHLPECQISFVNAQTLL